MKKKAEKSGTRTRSPLKKILGTPTASRLFIVIPAMLCVIGLFLLSVVPVRYDLAAGETPQVTIRASKEIVDRISTDRAREAAANAVSPVYIQQEGVTDEVLDDLDRIFEQLSRIQQYAETMLADRDPAAGYTSDELSFARDLCTEMTLTNLQLTTLMRSSADDIEKLYQRLKNNVNRVMSFYQVSDSNLQSQINYILEHTEDINTTLLVRLGKPILQKYVRPNVVIDEETWTEARQEAMDKVSPIIYHQGQNVIESGGEVITDYQIAVLDELGLLRGSTADYRLYLGSALLVTAILVCACLFMMLTARKHLLSFRYVLLVSIIFVVSFLICLVVRRVDIYLIPLLLCALLLTTMVSMRCGIILNTALCLLAASLAAGSSEEYSMTMQLTLVCGILSGCVSCLLMRKTPSRIRVLIVAPIVIFLNAIVCLSYSMLTTSDLAEGLNIALRMAGGTLISVVLYFVFQMILEQIFNLPTPLKLMELSNPNHPLLRRLMLEAPGTYHHSMIVANLAEASAEAIGADVLLARVGAYYHDIGKLMRPEFFKENQDPDYNVHDHTDPQVSAAILTAHIKDGAVLAREYRLPLAVQQIITTHHGDTPVMYFYHKALQQANGKPVDIDHFRYDSDPPSTREASIIMLCDTIEAAVRSMKTHEKNAVEEFIVKLIRGKLEDGQLSNSPLTLQDIDEISQACITVLSGVYHERIQYPSVPSGNRAHLRSMKKDEADRQPVTDPVPVPETAASDAVPPAPVPPETEGPSGKEAPSAPEQGSGASAAEKASSPAAVPETASAETDRQPDPVTDKAGTDPAGPLEEQTAPVPDPLPETAVPDMPEKEDKQPGPSASLPDDTDGSPENAAAAPERTEGSVTERDGSDTVNTAPSAAPVPAGPVVPVLVVEPSPASEVTRIEVPVIDEQPMLLDKLLQSMSETEESGTAAEK